MNSTMRTYLGIILYWKGLLIIVSLFLCFKATSYAADVTLQWDANTEPDLAGYKIHYDTNSGEPYAPDAADYAAQGSSPVTVQIGDLSDPNDPGYTLTGLDEGKGYFFAVTAYDDEGLESEYSNEAATCSVAAPLVTGETPTNDTTPTWTWSSGEGEGSGTYRYKLDNSDLASGATETTETSYTAETALSEESHTLYVSERDNVGRWSSTGSFTILIDITEPTSSATALSYENGTFSLTWTASDESSGVASTELWHKGPGGSWANTELNAQTGTSGTFSYTPTGEEEVEYGLYCFATRSRDNAGNVEEEPSGEGDISYTVTTTEPLPTPSGGGGGGGCFISVMSGK